MVHRIAYTVTFHTLKLQSKRLLLYTYECDVNEAVTLDKADAVEPLDPCHLFCLRYNFLSSEIWMWYALCAVWLCVSLKVRRMNWEKKPIGFSKWSQADSHVTSWMHIYTWLFQFIQNWKARDELRVIYCSYWFSWVTIFALFVKVKGPVITDSYNVVPLALDWQIVCFALYLRALTKLTHRSLSFLATFCTGIIPRLPALDL